MILDCVKTPGMYTGADFSEYIRLNSDKDFTRGQISGALAQLVDILIFHPPFCSNSLIIIIFVQFH